MNGKTLTVLIVFLAIPVIFMASRHVPAVRSPTAYVVFVDSTIKPEVSLRNPANSGYRLVVLTNNPKDPSKTTPVVSHLQDLFPGIKVAYIDYNRLKGKKLVERYGISTVPAYLLSLSIDSSQNYALVSNAMTQVGDVYLLNLDEKQVDKHI